MLDTNIKAQLKTYLERLVAPIELIASLDDGARSAEMRSLLEDIVSVSDKVTLREDGQDERRPSFSIGRAGEPARIRFAGLPMGHEFTSLILALLQASGYPPKVSDEVLDQIRHLDGDFRFETYVSLSCHNCPDVVQALNTMAATNPRIQHVMIDGALNQAEVETRQIMAVPSIWLNGEPFDDGRMTLEEILARLDTGTAAREAAKLAKKPPFDVLVIGGGPAGAAAAIYAARKGIRTGVLSERFGGQVMDTMTIENLISVLETDGPKLGRALEEHVRQYDIDIMNLQQAEALIPGGAGNLQSIRLANGAILHSKSVIIATGARWRELNVPGEKQYRGKGVAYCPHCDGPLFKGKRVAVVGGGNSGVEAAIDLANIVGHVTLLQSGDALRADAVLQDRLRKLTNVTVMTNVLTREITGAQGKVNGLVYADRISGEPHSLALEAVFIQIGLLPNTDWLKGTLNLTTYGEIETDARGATSAAGIFAAGDCTTVPYKQIIIAMGEGAKASLAAFDYLIRS